MLVGAARGARAAEAGAQAALLARGEQAERELRLGDAVTDYAEAERADPQSRLARKARARLDYLRPRSEGGFAPLAELLRARTEAARDRDALAAFEARVSGFPPGRVRRESRALVAESYLRLDWPLDAVRAHRAWLEEPELEDAEWLRASHGLALARARLGDLTGSLETLRARGLGASEAATHVQLMLIRRWARPLSVALVIGFVLLAVLVAIRRRPPGLFGRAFAPARVGVAVWVLGVPLLLAFFHRPETWRAMSFFTPGALVIVAAAALAGAALSAGERRAVLGLRVAGVLAQLAVAYLAFDSSGALFGWLVSARQG